jgi:type IV secretory pathway VirB2 component (pilin)
MKRLSRKTWDQIGIVLLISGVVIAMGVSAIRGLETWVQILGLVLGLVLVVAGLALARTFRSRGPDT